MKLSDEASLCEPYQTLYPIVVFIEQVFIISEELRLIIYKHISVINGISDRWYCMLFTQYMCII